MKRERLMFPILIHRFGLKDGKPKTLEQISKIYHITRERVRQIEAYTIMILRHPVRKKGFRRLSKAVLEK